jgi:hypothetical protein
MTPRYIIDTTEYQLVYDMAPRGRDWWFFTINSPGFEYIQLEHYGLYSDAKQQAIREAKHLGYPQGSTLQVHGRTRLQVLRSNVPL